MFNIVWGEGGGGWGLRLGGVKLYSRLACEKKCQNCKFVLRLLSSIVDLAKIGHNFNVMKPFISRCIIISGDLLAHSG